MMGNHDDLLLPFSAFDLQSLLLVVARLLLLGLMNLLVGLRSVVHHEECGMGHIAAVRSSDQVELLRLRFRRRLLLLLVTGKYEAVDWIVEMGRWRRCKKSSPLDLDVVY